MRLRACLLATVAVLLGSLAFAVPALAARPPSRAVLSHLVCEKALDPVARAVSVTATMRPVPGTQRLEMRVKLLRRQPHQGFTAVPVPAGSKLGSWITPADASLGQQPGDIWKVQFPVADLLAPATYRFQAQFRWLGAHDRQLALAERVSRDCHQPELRPDLLVRSFTVEAIPGRANVDRYVAVIANGGATGASDFQAQFSDDGSVQTKTISHLGAHHSAKLHFVGPACEAASPPTLVLDPQDRIDDFDRANNLATATCPTTTTSPSTGSTTSTA